MTLAYHSTFFIGCDLYTLITLYTDKKEKKFLIYKEIWPTASAYVTKYLSISSYIRKSFLIYDFATAPLWISLYMRKILFYFYHCTYLVLVPANWRSVGCSEYLLEAQKNKYFDKWIIGNISPPKYVSLKLSAFSS